MAFNNQLAKLFFAELKQYNRTNFKNLYSIDIFINDFTVIKAFSSVITRYFIFCEKHPEISESDKRVLYYMLKIDMIARFFASYPDTTQEDLVAFQAELKHYVKDNEEVEEYASAVTV